MMRWQEQGGELLSVLVKEASKIWGSIFYALQESSSLAASVWKSRQHRTKRKLTIYYHLSLDGVTREPGTLRSPFKFTVLCDTFRTPSRYFIKSRTSVKETYRVFLFS